MIRTACLLIKASSTEYIESQRFLRENFYLLPTGFLVLFAGLPVMIENFGGISGEKITEKQKMT